MNEIGKSAIFAVVAAALCGVVYWARPVRVEVEYFSDQGEIFYPDFTDPLEAASLEVIDFDEESGSARPFKVQVADGLWSIPSHHGYPADGEDRLAKTAAGLIELRKDIKQSDRVQDHEKLGVIDPLDDTSTALKGRGQRVTLRNAGGAVLADFIVGRSVEGKEGFRYMRIPEKNRTYAVKADLDISTQFADWIDTNLLQVTSSDLTSLVIADYSVDEATGTVDAADNVALTKDSGNKWTLAGLPESEELDEPKVNRMASSLSRITITGVRPKPESLARNLTLKQGLQLDPLTQLSLQSKGFFISRDGRLLSNEGEVRAGTKDGVRYTLRFGEVLFGEGLEVSAGSDGDTDAGEGADPEKPEGGTENRYLFVTASFDESLLGEAPVPPEGHQATEATEATTQPADEEGADDPARAAAERYDKELDDWNTKVEAGRKKAADLNARFAKWYYVISGSDFGNIRLDRAKLVRAKPDAD